jgi:hypothetical protein
VAEACTAERQHQANRAQLAAAGLGSTVVSRCLAAGSLLRLRRGAYALGPLASRGRHLLSDGVVDPGYLAEVQCVLLSLGAGCAADRRTGAVLWGMDLLVEPRTVECRVPRSRTRVSLTGVSVRSSTATDVQDLKVLGLEAVPVTPACETVLDCCLDRPMLEAVVIADSALRRRLVTVEDLVRAVGKRAGQPRVQRLRRLLALVDPESGSVLESMLRYLLASNGLHPTSQLGRGAAQPGLRAAAGLRLPAAARGLRWALLQQC